MNLTRMLQDHKWEILPRKDVLEAEETVRGEWGFTGTSKGLLTLPDGQAKFAKSDVPIVGISLLPHSLAVEGVNVCPNSTAECRANCLVYAGRGAMSTIHNGRGWKTQLLVDNPNAFYSMWWRELEAARKKWPDIRFRPNVFSDIHWEKLLPVSFWEYFSDVRFQDYTKGWQRKSLENYRLVFSANEFHTVDRIRAKINEGERVAVVFDLNKSDPLPKFWHGMPVIDGDGDDDLWSRPAGHIIGLRAKGKLRKAKSAFKRKVDGETDKSPGSAPGDDIAA